MSVTEHALRIQLESYRGALAELSTRMAEAADKHLAELAQCQQVKQDLENRLEEVSAASLRAVKLYNEANATAEEVKGKIGAITVEKRDLKQALDVSEDSKRRLAIISAYIFRAADEGINPIKLPSPNSGPKVAQARRTVALDEGYDGLLSFIQDLYEGLSTDELSQLIGG